MRQCLTNWEGSGRKARSRPQMDRPHSSYSVAAGGAAALMTYPSVMPERKVVDSHGSSECRRSGNLNDVFSWSFKYLVKIQVFRVVTLCLGERDDILL